ncbi:MAG: phosphatidylglycerophosphatase A [Candidatus Omnitrophota bacterium]
MIELITTFFYIGYLPLMPGTWISLVGVFLYLIFDKNPIYFGLLGLFIILGFLLCGKAEEIFGKKDPKFIVIDDLVGMMLVLGFLPKRFFMLVMGFTIFRIIDAVKPYPINRLEKLDGSLGIMLDDLMAAAYAILVMGLFLRLIR